MKANHILSMHVFNSNLLIQKNVKTNGLPGFGIPCLQQSTGTLIVKLQGLKCPLSKYVGKSFMAKLNIIGKQGQINYVKWQLISIRTCWRMDLSGIRWSRFLLQLCTTMVQIQHCYSLTTGVYDTVCASHVGHLWQIVRISFAATFNSISLTCLQVQRMVADTDHKVWHCSIAKGCRAHT